MEKHSIKEFLASVWDNIQSNGTYYNSSISEKSIFQGPFKELLAFSGSIEDPTTRFIDSPNFNLGFAISRLFYLLRGTNTLEEIAFYAPGAKEYSDDGRHLFGSSYGHKIFGNGNFWEIVQKLKTTTNSKRLYFPIFDENDFLRDSKDIPCVTGVLLQPRGDILNMTLQMRANDAQKLLPYNIFEFSILQECLSISSGMNLGKFYYTAGTIHLRGQENIENSVNPWTSAKTLEVAPMNLFDKNILSDLLVIEEKIRNKIPELDRDSYINFAESITSTQNLYWREFLIILCDHGYTVFHKENPPKYKSNTGLNLFEIYIKNKK
jgi:hypothetical protein